MKFIRIKFNSSEYHESLRIRDLYLRKPLGLKLSDQDLENEEKQYHFGVIENSSLIASVVIKPITEFKVKLRQMIVLPEFQGRGVGRFLIDEVEKSLCNQGIEEIEMAARFSKKGFYQKLGYRSIGDIFFEVGIEHIKMNKKIKY